MIQLSVGRGRRCSGRVYPAASSLWLEMIRVRHLQSQHVGVLYVAACRQGTTTVQPQPNSHPPWRWSHPLDTHYQKVRSTRCLAVHKEGGVTYLGTYSPGQQASQMEGNTGCREAKAIWVKLSEMFALIRMNLFLERSRCSLYEQDVWASSGRGKVGFSQSEPNTIRKHLQFG